MKETFYFTHDYNAHSDEKVLKLRRELGLEGYGIYWYLVELLASSSEARLSFNSIDDIAFDMQTECERIANVIRLYGLFQFNDTHFWSNRLVSFFKEKELKSTKAKASAKVRWSLEANKNANAMQSQCDGNAIKERKGKESKGKEKKEIYGSCKNVKILLEEYKELENRFPTDLGERIENLSLYIASKGDKYKSHYATILSWARKEPMAKVDTTRKSYDLTKIEL